MTKEIGMNWKNVNRIKRVGQYIGMITMLSSVFSCSDPRSADLVSELQYNVTIDVEFPHYSIEPASRTNTGRTFINELPDLQNELSTDDIYVLAFQNDKLALYRNFVFAEISGGDKKLNFKFSKSEITNDDIEFVVLANLQKNLKGSLFDLLSGAIGQHYTDVYKKLTYEFSGVWDISQRHIPMWGKTAKIPIGGLPVSPQKTGLDCKLFRAVAKVGFMINVDTDTGEARGYPKEKIRISKVKVRGAMNKGWVAPMSHDESVMDVTGAYPFFKEPFIPGAAQPLTNDLEFVNSDNAETFTREFMNYIYLPEQQTNKNKLIIEIYYSFNGTEQKKPRVIDFSQNVVRNHSYVYCLRLSSEQNIEIDYKVMQWKEYPEVEIPFGTTDAQKK